MEQSFTGLVEITYFTPENARFYETENGFAAMEAFLPPIVKDDLEEGEGEGKSAEGEKTWQDVGRVLFHRAFPFARPDEYISVLDEDSKEYGIIKNLSDFDGHGREIIERALKRKYYCPEIKKIKRLKEQFGYSCWEVETDMGDMEMVLKDTFGSIIRISDTYLVINDVSGNRYIIPDVTKLDRKSFRKIELYL